MTINDTWGYKPHDLNFKSSADLLRMLVETASKGGNLLLNVGPKPDGTIPQEMIDRLEYIGSWLEVNGDAIYGTTASPFPRKPNWGRCTTGKPGESTTPLYLHVLEWPKDGKLTVLPLDNKVVGAYLLADKQRNQLPFEQLYESTTITLPRSALHDTATVVVLEVEGQPVAAPIRFRPNESGQLVLRAADAVLHGQTIRYAGDVDSVGCWTNLEDSVSWDIELPSEGTYSLHVTYGCEAGNGGRYALSIGEQICEASTKPTGGWFTRVIDSIGSVKLPAGKATLQIALKAKQGDAVMDLTEVKLTRID